MTKGLWYNEQQHEVQSHVNQYQSAPVSLQKLQRYYLQCVSLWELQCDRNKKQEWSEGTCKCLKIEHLNSDIKWFLCFWSNLSQFLSSCHGWRKSPPRCTVSFEHCGYWTSCSPGLIDSFTARPYCKMKYLHFCIPPLRQLTSAPAIFILHLVLLAAKSGNQKQQSDFWKLLRVW